ncbi:MAG: hypothetical protein WCA35_26235 [Kovacikia sp.]
MNKDADQILVEYSLSHPREVLRVLAILAEEHEEDELLYFRGEVSSLRRATPPDPTVPLLGPQDQITRIDRWEAPFNPVSPIVLEEHISLESLIG